MPNEDARATFSQEDQCPKRELVKVTMECNIYRKAMACFAKEFAARYPFIAQQPAVWANRTPCWVLRVASSGSYNWALARSAP